MTAPNDNPLAYDQPTYATPYWDQCGTDQQKVLDVYTNVAAQIINRPDHEVHVLGRFNPDQLCVYVRKSHGRGSVPRTTALSVIVHVNGAPILNVIPHIVKAALLLRDAELRPIAELQTADVLAEVHA